MTNKGNKLGKARDRESVRKTESYNTRQAGTHKKPLGEDLMSRYHYNTGHPRSSGLVKNDVTLSINIRA